MPRQLIVLFCLAALVAGCGKHRLWKKKQKPEMNQPAAYNTATAFTAPDLAGTWNLQLPGGHRGAITINAIDNNNLSLNAGGTLSGNYVVQGPHLLILTPDKRLYMTAWQIMGKDNLLLVRAPAAADVGSDYTGATLTRAAATAPAPAGAPAPAPAPR